MLSLFVTLNSFVHTLLQHSRVCFICVKHLGVCSTSSCTSIFEITSSRVSLKYWVLGDALRHLSVYVMVLHRTIVQLASVAWKFIALADSFILERFQTNISVVWDVKPCILLRMCHRFGRAFSLQLRPSWSTVKVQLVCPSDTLCPILRSTPRREM